MFMKENLDRKKNPNVRKYEFWIVYTKYSSSKSQPQKTEKTGKSKIPGIVHQTAVIVYKHIWNQWKIKKYDWW